MIRSLRAALRAAALACPAVAADHNSIHLVTPKPYTAKAVGKKLTVSLSPASVTVIGLE